MTQYTVDAFTGELFCGNPAAINILDRWPEKALMMKITRENNLSETAFAVPEGEGYRLRWFTPGGEIDLCGHPGGRLCDPAVLPPGGQAGDLRDPQREAHRHRGG